MSEIVTLDPESYADAKEVAAHFRSGVPVIVNIGSMSEADAKRMLDFMIGLKEGLEGHLGADAGGIPQRDDKAIRCSFHGIGR